MDAERRKIILSIVSQFESQEFCDVWANESIGGNAGSNRAAINSFVDKETGEIIMFGNIQDIPDGIRHNRAFSEVTFLYDLGTSLLVSIAMIYNKVPPIPQVSERIIMVSETEECGISLTAKANLKVAIRMVNHRLATRLEEQIEELRKELKNS